MTLTAAQLQAVDHVRSIATAQRMRAEERIQKVLGKAGLEAGTLVPALGRVGLNFHPDRLLRDGRTVAQAMLSDGVYRSQFESGISNGSRTAFRGGSRDRWEETLFGGAYHSAAVTPTERPKYGALNLMHHRDGPAPRFGSCHVRLRPAVLERCTFCFGDSHVGPADVGTIDAFDGVFAALLEAVDAAGFALGVDAIDVAWLVNALQFPPVWRANGRALDHYVEAQVHGDVILSRDTEGLIADPSFRSSETGAALEQLAKTCQVELQWHAGFELPFDHVPDNFRGPRMPDLAIRIARDHASPGERLNAEVLGRAAASVVAEPERWRDWAGHDDTLQHVKQLWHVLVRYGSPISV